MEPMKVAKTVIRFLAKSGISAATANLVVSNRNVSENVVFETYYKTASLVGGAATGWMIGDLVADFTGQKFDELAASFKQHTTQK